MTVSAKNTTTAQVAPLVAASVETTEAVAAEPAPAFDCATNANDSTNTTEQENEVGASEVAGSHVENTKEITVPWWVARSSNIPRTEPERLELLKNAVNGYWIKDFTDPEFYYSELARNIAAIQKDDASDEEKKQFTKDQEAHWREVIPIEYRYPWDEVEQKQ